MRGNDGQVKRVSGIRHIQVETVLAQRVEQILAPQPGVVARKMFGSLAFMLNGKMAVRVQDDNLVVRVGEANQQQALEHPFAKPLIIRGASRPAWVTIEPEGINTEAKLAEWVQRGVAFASSLPAK